MSSGPVWRKSSFSGSEGDNCVEVAVRPGGVRVRDTKDTKGTKDMKDTEDAKDGAVPGVKVSPGAWAVFTRYVGGRER
ncbi:DUF397 domain-containing protein [Streptomyces sp. NRRL S-1868]|uniref:DUF397 domain-containing protein n=1 Tax=Streptomyces sp. NRRL S-1868 TaxID=1463892 RepID=UPI0005670241|nr:DUF397 domain-containing protein [Streptomyces sp. NRRL S-1868]